VGAVVDVDVDVDVDVTHRGAWKSRWAHDVRLPAARCV